MCSRKILETLEFTFHEVNGINLVFSETRWGAGWGDVMSEAVITVDLGGIVCDYEKVFDIVERKKSLFTPLSSDGTPLGDLSSRVQHAIGRVAVVADCAHSLGASRIFHGEKKYCGAIADFSSFSFIAGKFSTAQDTLKAA